MKLTFLGVASALSVGYKNFHSNMLLEAEDGKALLIDCGGDVRHALYELGYDPQIVSAVYLSHLHADHVGGMEWLGFAKFFIEQKKLPLYISSDQKTRLWNNVLSGGMSTLEETDANLETFFKVADLADGQFEWNNVLCKLIKVPHTYSNYQLLPSYGLLIKCQQRKIFITTDTRFAPDVLMESYNDADIIFHDCETSAHLSLQHAHYNQLVTLPPEIKAKMWLYGYNSGALPDAIGDGFCGFVVRGQQFEV